LRDQLLPPPPGREGPSPGRGLDAFNHCDYRREVIDKQVRLMHDRGIWARPDNGAGASGG
jgi:hypothetical protein